MAASDRGGPRPLSLQFPNEKCDLCKKKVFSLEKIAARGKMYHNTCFVCSKCSQPIIPESYGEFDDKLFCLRHFNEKTSSSKKVSSNQDDEVCSICTKAVYAMEKVKADDKVTRFIGFPFFIYYKRF